jgi:hypothetical protein
MLAHSPTREPAGLSGELHASSLESITPQQIVDGIRFCFTPGEQADEDVLWSSFQTEKSEFTGSVGAEPASPQTLVDEGRGSFPGALRKSRLHELASK